jgi:molybdopterin-guanine dinucleotide biosynthesis protein B
MPAMIQVIGPSGSGKTRAIEEAIRRLRRRGLRVGVLKHSHHSLEVAGKDTDRFRKAGGNVVVFASDQCVLFSDWEPAAFASVLPVDVLLIEGYHRRGYPGARFTVRNPEEAVVVGARIDRSVPAPVPRAVLRGDGRRTPPGELWEMVGNLMRKEGILHLELLQEPPRAAATAPRRARKGRARR